MWWGAPRTGRDSGYWGSVYSGSLVRAGIGTAKRGTAARLPRCLPLAAETWPSVLILGPWARGPGAQSARQERGADRGYGSPWGPASLQGTLGSAPGGAGRWHLRLPGVP